MHFKTLFTANKLFRMPKFLIFKSPAGLLLPAAPAVSIFHRSSHYPLCLSSSFLCCHYTWLERSLAIHLASFREDFKKSPWIAWLINSSNKINTSHTAACENGIVRAAVLGLIWGFSVTINVYNWCFTSFLSL